MDMQDMTDVIDELPNAGYTRCWNSSTCFHHRYPVAGLLQLANMHGIYVAKVEISTMC